MQSMVLYDASPRILSSTFNHVAVLVVNGRHSIVGCKPSFWFDDDNILEVICANTSCPQSCDTAQRGRLVMSLRKTSEVAPSTTNDGRSPYFLFIRTAFVQKIEVRESNVFVQLIATEKVPR